MDASLDGLEHQPSVPSVGVPQGLGGAQEIYYSRTGTSFQYTNLYLHLLLARGLFPAIPSANYRLTPLSGVFRLVDLPKIGPTTWKMPLLIFAQNYV